jgi:hypothetical protein
MFPISLNEKAMIYELVLTEALSHRSISALSV